MAGRRVNLTVPAPERLEGHTLAEASLTWASLGWTVFPIVPRGKTPYGSGEFCQRTDEHACGFHCATHDQGQIAAWWAAHPDSNIGLTSPEAVFVDEDRIGALLENSVHLPKCPWEITGRAGGGRHFFLKAPATWPGLAGDSVKVNYRLAGIELKGYSKGYVVAAPSVHASGTAYQVKLGGYVPECPAKVLDQIVEVTNVGIPQAMGNAFITVGGYQLPASVPVGGRYKAMLAYVAHLYNREHSDDEMQALVRTMLVPRFVEPLTEREFREHFGRTIKDLEKNLGPRRAVTAAMATGPLEDSPLTEFDSRPIQWLWPSWLPRGVVTLMDGNPGVSKSTLVADLVARITTARPWPDGAAGSAPGRVLWITTEDDPGRVLRPRIEAAGGDASLVRFVTSEVVFPGSASAFQELLVRRATEPLGLSFVVLDPLFSHMDSKVKSISDADMRQNVMNPLGSAAEAADVSILVVRHFNKDTTAGPLNRGAGSLGGIVGAARALWSVALDPGDETGETRAVGVTKLNYARSPLPMRYRVVDRLPPGWVTGSVSGIEWIGQAPVSIATMMAEPNDVGGAVAALGEILAGGPMGATAVANVMRARGFGKDATKGAKQRLRVVSTKTGMAGGWEWSLGHPFEDAEDAEGVGATPSATPSASSALAGARAGAHVLPPVPTSSASSVDGHPFEDAEGVGAGGLHAPAREADPDLVAGCSDYAGHQLSHYHLSDGWHCRSCEEEESA